VAELAAAVAMNTPQATVGAGSLLMAFRAQGPKVEATFGSRRRADFAQVTIACVRRSGPVTQRSKR
jgi:hypothetical protein